MDRVARSVALLLACGIVASCGEPLVVLGDAPGLMRIVLGGGDSIGTRVDSLAVRTRLTEPSAVLFDPVESLLYAADRGALRQVGGTTTRVARLFSVTSDGRARVIIDAGGCASGTCILSTSAMAFAPDGGIIIADGVGHRVFRYRGQNLTVIAGTGVAGTSPDGTPQMDAMLNRPRGVAVGDDGRIYISEAGSHLVRVIEDGVIRTVAGTGVAGHSGDEGPATAAALNEPAGLDLHNGTLYVADFLAAVVRAISPDGTITTVAGTPNAASFSGDDGPATWATLNRPVAVSVTPDGTQLFIADQSNHRIRIVSLETGTIRTFAGTGSPTYNGNRRPAGDTSLRMPSDVSAAANGFLLIVDTGHSVVWRTTTGFD